MGPRSPVQRAISRLKGMANDSAVSCAKMAELIDLLFWVVDSGGLTEAQVQSYSPGDANVPLWEVTLDTWRI